jgi:hypothetical protein
MPSAALSYFRYLDLIADVTRHDGLALDGCCRMREARGDHWGSG